MIHRIEVAFKTQDARADTRKKELLNMGFSNVSNVRLVDVYTINANLSETDLKGIASVLSNKVIQRATINQFQAPEQFDWAIEIGFLPGVTDNIGNTAKQIMEDLLKIKLSQDDGISSSQLVFLSGNLTGTDATEIANSLANKLIQRIHIKSHDEFVSDGGMDVVYPKVVLNDYPSADVVEIINAADNELKIIGKEGIANSDGTRRGPLALDLNYMKAIQEYFRKEDRNPTDIEMECIAQTWSEHCKHTIFKDSMDDIKDGLFRTFIKGATERIRKEKGNKDFCVSVFKDNSGAIIFNEDYLVTHKVETHNSPSALDPFGGAITGIVGVNRDAIGFGLGAKPIINTYGFCFANPGDKTSLYKGQNFTQKMFNPKRIMDGVIYGVNVGGNCSGIPTTSGFVLFDERYKGKPLVFVGTSGLIPKESAGRLSYEKQAQAGDYIVMAGGRVGKDGIHGATFSSEAMDSKSPATAVQIGDPITQKKFSDAILKEARDLQLYNSITDNGAGGLSCSVAEMAIECGGCEVNLDYVPLKYPGLAPWEIYISESQERMTLAVPKDKWEQFSDLMKRRGVEATIIGVFTNSGRCAVNHNGKKIVDIDMNFLHDGLPPRPMKTTYTKQSYSEPIHELKDSEDLTESLNLMLSRLNIAGYEFISQQYDHEVQGGSVIKPLQGKGRINGDATITRPLLDSYKGVIISYGINPTYSDIDTYHMAACAIDSSIRNAVAAGADIKNLALLDNFCWCSSDESEKLGQLKEAARACYDYSVAYGTPFISGKDSMFNDFKGYDESGKPVKISIPPTLLISSIGVIEDSRKAVSLDAKSEGDLVYVLGETHDELGASEYFSMIGEQQRGKKYIGNSIPKVDAEKNKKLYEAYSKCVDEGIIASAQAVGKGGLAVALGKTAMGGKLGMHVSLQNLPGTSSRNEFSLYSESQGRLVVTTTSQHKDRFEEIMKGNIFANIGTVGKDNAFIIKGMNGNIIINTNTDSMLNSYKSTFKNY